MTKTRVNGKWSLNLPEHRHAFWADNVWEPERLEHMHSTISAGERVLYIGAEEGDMPALLCSWGAELFNVKPASRVWPNIKSCWQMNDLPDPVGNFVGFCGKTDSYNAASGWFDGWPLCADGPVVSDHTFPTLRDNGQLQDGLVWLQPVVTVDTISASKFVPDVISVDVEGAEWEVLQGAERTISEHRPRIYLSLHPDFLVHDYGVDQSVPRNFITNFGYKEQLLAHAHEDHFYYEP